MNDDYGRTELYERQHYQLSCLWGVLASESHCAQDGSRLCILKVHRTVLLCSCDYSRQLHVRVLMCRQLPGNTANRAI